MATVNEKMTAIADEVRSLSGETSTMGLDAMKNALHAIPRNDSSDITASGETVTIPAGYYASQITKSVDTATQATPSISVDANGLITASATQTAGYVNAGTESATQQLDVQAETTITPKNFAQYAVTAGKYVTGDIIVTGDSDLLASNIKKDVDIFGVVGTYEGGVAAQVATGTVTGVSGTAKTVSCGFKPDAVFFTGTNPHDNTGKHGGVVFSEAKVTTMDTIFAAPNTNYLFSTFTVTQTSTGFSVKGIRVSTSIIPSNESNRSLDYIAIKYTE